MNTSAPQARGPQPADEGEEKAKKRRAKVIRVSPAPANAPNECWSIDFVADRLSNGQRIRAFTIVDNCSRHSPLIEVDYSLPAPKLTAALDVAIAKHGKPSVLRMNNGTEFTSRHFDQWAWGRRIRLDYITPGKPTENGFIESFNGRLRDECL